MRGLWVGSMMKPSPRRNHVIWSASYPSSGSSNSATIIEPALKDTRVPTFLRRPLLSRSALELIAPAATTTCFATMR